MWHRSIVAVKSALGLAMFEDSLAKLIRCRLKGRRVRDVWPRCRTDISSESAPISPPNGDTRALSYRPISNHAERVAAWPAERLPVSATVRPRPAQRPGNLRKNGGKRAQSVPAMLPTTILSSRMRRFPRQISVTPRQTCCVPAHLAAAHLAVSLPTCPLPLPTACPSSACPHSRHPT